jgi:hypothetical protein
LFLLALDAQKPLEVLQLSLLVSSDTVALVCLLQEHTRLDILLFALYYVSILDNHSVMRH